MFPAEDLQRRSESWFALGCARGKQMGTQSSLRRRLVVVRVRQGGALSHRRLTDLCAQNEQSRWCEVTADAWANDGIVAQTIEEQRERCLGAYEQNPDLIEEHFGIERGIAEGGYGRRQLYELIQNGADAILVGDNGWRVEVVLTEGALYCANQGAPIDKSGVRAILGAHRSSKRSDEIGRFGVGFKSVLAVTDTPEFFSRSGSFRFDPQRSEDLIAERVGVRNNRAPRLRLAFPLDAREAADTDHVLRSMMTWATTVVRLPRNLGTTTDWLSEDLEQFPAEFALFSPHVKQLRLRDHSRSIDRTVSAKKSKGGLIDLAVDGRVSKWRVIKSRYEMSETARAQAGELSDRDELPLIWAVPMEGANARGRFWAFFPTQYHTTLSGILNAPWKTNTDRQNLLESRFNDELIEFASDRIVRSLPKLQTEDDPGRPIDLLPGRGREAPNWADEKISADIIEFAKMAPSIPDLDGKLRRPRQIRLAPANLPEEACRLHAEICPDRSWSHPSIQQRHRYARVERIIQLPASDVADWLGSLLEDPTEEASRQAIRVAVELKRAGTGGWDGVPIVRTSKGTLAAPNPNLLFMGEGDSSAAPDIDLVCPAFAADSEMRALLEELEIQSLDETGRLSALVAVGDAETSAFWSGFWPLSRAVGARKALNLLTDHVEPQAVRAMTETGDFVRIGVLTLPGGVVYGGVLANANANAVIDTKYHADDLAILRELGVTDKPEAGRNPRLETWWNDYYVAGCEAFRASPGVAPSKPRYTTLEWDNAGYVGPCAPLHRLSPEANADYCAEILANDDALGPWAIRHPNKKYGTLRFLNPALWMVREHGWLRSSVGPVPASEAVGASLERHRDYLPVLEVSDAVANQLALPMSEDDLRGPVLAKAVERATALGPRAFGTALALAVNGGLAPLISLQHQGRGGTIELAEVVVCTSQVEAAVREATSLYAVVDDAAVRAELVSEWSMRSADDLFAVTVHPIRPTGRQQVADLFPTLSVLGVSDDLVICDELEIHRTSDAGRLVESRSQWRDDGVLFVAAEEDDRNTILEAVIDLTEIDLDHSEREALLAETDRKAAAKLRRAIAAEKGIEAKLLAAIGPEALRRSLPQDLLAEIEQHGERADDTKVAQLALAVDGVELLRNHRDDLAQNGLDVPKTWAGGRAARKFCVELGFPDEFAGFARPPRDSLVLVDGPPQMPSLHGFQRESADLIRDLVRRGRGRGLLALPTGAGKTRTAITAFIEAMREGELEGPILWVAQTDELCEQAVQSWSDNWRAMGPRGTLKLGRLWSSNSVEHLSDPYQVVVATIAKLAHCFDDKQYAWLSKANALIIDEAHRALSSDYTRLLEWVGMGRNQDRVPLLGLSATPYRGTSEEETKRLVARFGATRLDRVDGDPYRTLQDMGVLSEVDHELLAGTQVTLSQDELQALTQTRRLPGTVLNRIGEDTGRNTTILESIQRLPDTATVLLFAASVQHAELLAGLLSAKGIPSRAISARTDRGARRHYIDQFRTGEVRVLTNFHVLTEGFDAPAVSAVYLARPTYSPSVYQQMIGRGLRGPLNGGKERCIVVNVADNLAQYGEELAFKEFEPLWNSEASNAGAH